MTPGTDRLTDRLDQLAASGRLDAADHAVLTRRVRRWGRDLLDGLGVYGEGVDGEGVDGEGVDGERGGLAERILERLVETRAARRPALRELDEERVLRPDWFAAPDQVGYVCYTERFAGTLAGVAERIGYLDDLGVTYLHLMPLLEPRNGPDDGGYAVRDYRRVRPDLGTMDDLATLADALHGAGIALTLDLVLNHVAAEHEWAVAARAGDERYLRYFLTYPDRTWPDRYEETLPEVFPDFAPGNFTWVPEIAGGRWVWTTFNAFQWDLDWSNPDVFCELLDVICFLANVGVDCLRLDAIAFLWKRLGTSCQNQPEVHDIVMALRAAMRIAAPAVIFKAEAIVAPEDLPAYLGTGRHAGKVCDLAYHNSLMVQLWSSLASGDVGLARRTLAAPPPKPVTTAWATYVRCHDDIGWAISDALAAASGLSGHDHRAFLSHFYGGDHPGSFARGEIFQSNPQTQDARISGSLASLAGLQSALEAGDPSAVDAALGRIFVLHAVVCAYGGVPLLYMGDELGLLNDPSYLGDPDQAADNRWLHRPWMRWDLAEQRHDPATVPGRIFAGVRHLVRLRAGLPALHAAVESVPVDLGSAGLLGLRRRHPSGDLLAVHNLRGDWQPVAADVVDGLLPGARAGLREHVSAFAPAAGGDGRYWVAPYAAWWLTAR